MSEIRARVTKFLVLVISTLGLVSTLTMLAEPPEKDLAAQDIFALNSQALASRGIASLGAEANESRVKLDCDSKSQEAETASPRIRLDGLHCLIKGESPIITTQVRNKTNGYVATVFHRSDDAFTTDYIHLKEGENKIQVEFHSGKVTEDRVLTVKRLPASAKK
ncbi:MAG: hypothetical protein IT289_06290 [Oligoflexia bacterium]|nr:hypothetical protein [Oligoflexia bacterium]